MPSREEGWVTDSGVIDRSALDALIETTGGDPDFFAEMIDTFLADSPQLVAEMQTATSSADTQALRRAAHTLKSNSRTFGASALADLCQEIEGRAATGGLDGLARLVARVVAVYPGVAAALVAERPDA
jgi:HPt (histidine-containing phosphotransfer) domain-containing protein